jgi:hypothetical protein
MPLFLIFISQIGIEMSTFIFSNFAWGLHGGVDMKWSVIVVRVKVSRGIEPFFPMEIDIADTSQPPNVEMICMDKSHLLPNNPARQ